MHLRIVFAQGCLQGRPGGVAQGKALANHKGGPGGTGGGLQAANSGRVVVQAGNQRHDKQPHPYPCGGQAGDGRQARFRSGALRFQVTQQIGIQRNQAHVDGEIRLAGNAAK